MKPTHRHSEQSLPEAGRQARRGGQAGMRSTLSHWVGQTFLSAYSTMKRFTHSRWIAAVALTGLLLTLALAACGGSGSGPVGGTPPPPPAPPPLSISTTSLPDGNLNQSYSATLQASGGTGARTWSITTGSLPDGLSLDGSTGAISGTPTVDASFSFTVQVADSGSPQQVATRALSILIRTDALIITTTLLPGGEVGVAYSQFVSATNGQQPFSWSTSGNVPPGLSIDSNTGEIGGLPTTEGPSSFTVRVTDDLGDTATAALSIDIASAPPLMITTTALPNGSLISSYDVTLQATGGTPPLAWSQTGTFPPGLILQTNGKISGTPTMTGMFDFTVQVDDSVSSPPDTQTLRITILTAPPGRNDTIATATPLFNGTARASISPYTDPVNTTPANPDVDVYEITATAGNIVEVRICARSLTDPRCTLTTPSPLDSVIEIVSDDGTPDGARFLSACNDPSDDNLPPPFTSDPTPAGFDDDCVNDDINLGVVQDSRLEFRVPTGTTVFYVRVLDWRGDARPDLLYDIIISGAN